RIKEPPSVNRVRFCDNLRSSDELLGTRLFDTSQRIRSPAVLSVSLQQSKSSEIRLPANSWVTYLARPEHLSSGHSTNESYMLNQRHSRRHRFHDGKTNL